jgi:hypothetical protein
MRKRTRAGFLTVAGLSALMLGGLSGCAPTVVEDRDPDTTVVTPAPKTDVVPVPGPQGPAGPAGPPGAPGAPGSSGN